MFLKIIFFSMSLFLLQGCKEAVISNNLSEQYKLDKDFLNTAYNDLKFKEDLFYIDVGYFEKEQNNLVIFLLYNSPYFNEVFLDKAELVVDKQTIDTVTQLKVDEIEELIAGKKYAKGGSRLVFNISDPKKILGKDPKLKVYIKSDTSPDANVTIPLSIVFKRIWPT